MTDLAIGMKIIPTLALRQERLLAITPELRQAIGLLQMGAHELSRFIQEQGQENPFLQVSQGDTVATASSHDSPSSAVTRHGVQPAFPPDTRALPDHSERLAARTTLMEHVAQQLSYVRLTAKEKRVAFAFVEALEPSGWLGSSIEEVAAKTQAEPRLCEEVLGKLQTVEPAGLFARNLAECLALQLTEQDRADGVLMEIMTHLHEFAENGADRFAAARGVQPQDVETALRRLRGLDPKPGAAFAADDVPLVVPDIIVDRLGSGWAVSLNKGALPTVEIDRRYSGLLAECDEKAEGMEAFRKQLGTAKWIIHAIQRRQETLLKVGSALVQYQADFLEGGREALKPLLQKDIAKQLKISESTVSRIVNAMYIQTPTTVLPLRAFFCAGIHAEIGQKVMSSAQIQGRIRSMVAAENPANPLSDGRIAEALHRDGIPIARRTVAKYRELARIPSRALRRKRP